MADENLEQPNTPQYSESETKAMEQGWVPKDQWTGEGKWRDADSFLDRGELFSKIDAQNRKLKTTEQALVALQQHYGKVQETEYKRALKTLQDQKKEAIIENNPDEIVRLDDEIADLKAVKTAPAPVQQPSGPHPAFVAWEARNPWYNADPKRRAYADEVGVQLAQQGKSPFEVLMDVTDAVNKKFATNPMRDKTSGVEGGGSAPTGKSNSHVELSETETQIMKKLVGSGTLTKDQYIADIRKQRERQ